MKSGIGLFVNPMFLHDIAAFVGSLPYTVGKTLVIAFPQQNSAVAEVVGVGEILVVIRAFGMCLYHIIVVLCRLVRPAFPY